MIEQAVDQQRLCQARSILYTVISYSITHIHCEE